MFKYNMRMLTYIFLKPRIILIQCIQEVKKKMALLLKTK